MLMWDWAWGEGLPVQGTAEITASLLQLGDTSWQVSTPQHSSLQVPLPRVQEAAGVWPTG